MEDTTAMCTSGLNQRRRTIHTHNLYAPLCKGASKPSFAAADVECTAGGACLNSLNDGRVSGYAAAFNPTFTHRPRPGCCIRDPTLFQILAQISAQRMVVLQPNA